ncbi:MAG TPA: nuclear transport factor 2 family protein [Solimonas sp.]|nr:nuclear transport factor 2 family protein [Solimonas sp.]
MSRPFAERFAEAWARPTPQGLVALLHPEVVLYQPHLPPIRGRDAALHEFQRLLAWLPQLHGTVERWSESAGDVFIEWEMRLPLGKDLVRIRAVDRFRVADGLGMERAVYFDQVQLIRAVATHPRLWWGYLRYRYG